MRVHLVLSVPMPQYLAELYLSRANADGVIDTLDRARAVNAMPAGGASVRYLRSIFVPGDEICLHLFEAANAAAVCGACRGAGIPVDRVMEANEFPSLDRDPK
jgi:hypothetical protein